MKRIKVTELVRGESVRGKPGIFGRAEITEKNGDVVAVAFSRLDGEERWFADSMWIGEMPQFAHGQGERGVTKHVLAGSVEEAVKEACRRKGFITYPVNGVL